MKVSNLFIPFVLVLSVTLIGCSNNNPFKSSKNISQATGWKISTKVVVLKIKNLTRAKELDQD